MTLQIPDLEHVLPPDLGGITRSDQHLIILFDHAPIDPCIAFLCNMGGYAGAKNRDKLPKLPG